MKPRLIGILTALIALARIEPKEKEVVEKQKAEIETLKGEIATFHGDSDLNDPEVISLIDDATEVLAAAKPDKEHVDNAPEGAATEKPQEGGEQS